MVFPPTMNSSTTVQNVPPAVMGSSSSPSSVLPLYVVISALQFAVPQILSPGEARLLSKGAASALNSSSFWHGMTIDLERDEGADLAQHSSKVTVPKRNNHPAEDTSTLPNELPVKRRGVEGSHPATAMVTNINGSTRSQSRPKAIKPRSNADCLGIKAPYLDAHGRRAGTRGAAEVGGGSDISGNGVGTGKRSRIAVDVSPDSKTGAGATWEGRGGVEHGHFLRCYHHHVAFRRLAQPVTDTKVAEMPASLYPTCLVACGQMVALGTREGPVLLFNLVPLEPSTSNTTPSPEGLPHGHGELNSTSTPFTPTECSSSRSDIKTNNSTYLPQGFNAKGNAFPQENLRTSGDRTLHGGSSRMASRAVAGRGGSSAASDRGILSFSVSRVYGSLVEGAGPISAVLLDRTKIIAAGHGSRRSGGGYVIRIYAVDTTKLLRTLRCSGEVSRMCLFDPVLAVLSATSGRISFRDIYADAGSGLGQRTALGVEAVAFAPIEGQNSVARDGHSVILHCVKSNGTIFEASASGDVWNVEQDGAGVAENGLEAWGAATIRQGWHICADMKALLLVRATPGGTISGWRLHPSGRRARGLIFSFRLESVTVSPVSSAARVLKSVYLAAGGMILATAREGAAPRLWDVRLARRRAAPATRSRIAATAVGVARLSMQSATREAAPRGVLRWGLASVEAAEGLTGGAEICGQSEDDGAGQLASTNNEEQAVSRGTAGARPRQQRPQCVRVRRWPMGVWAVGVTVDPGRGRLVSACSDGRLRVTKLRPNNQEQRLRAAVLRGRQAQHL